MWEELLRTDGNSQLPAQSVPTKDSGGEGKRARSEVELEKKESVPNWGKVFSVCSSSSPLISIFNWQ